MLYVKDSTCRSLVIEMASYNVGPKIILLRLSESSSPIIIEFDVSSAFLNQNESISKSSSVRSLNNLVLTLPKCDN